MINNDCRCPGCGTCSAVDEVGKLRHKLKGEAAHIKSLEGLLVDALRERDEARAEADAVRKQLGLNPIEW